MCGSTKDAGERNQLRTGLSLALFFEKKTKNIGVNFHPYAFLVLTKRKGGKYMFKNNYDVKEFGARVRKIRKENKMTQEELASRLMLTA